MKAFDAAYLLVRHKSEPQDVALPGKCGEHQLRNHEVFYEEWEPADAGVSA